MAAPSIADVWDETRRFVLREQGLLLPIGFSTFGAAALIVSLVAPQRTAPTQMSFDSWMLWLIPAMLLAVVGNLALSTLALRSRASVEEGFVAAFRLLPRAIGLMLIVGLMFLVLALVAGTVAGIMALLTGLGPQATTMIATLGLVPVAFWLSARLMLLWPTLADRNGGALDSLRCALQATRGQAALLVGLMLVNLLLFTVLAAVLELAGGSVLLLVTRLVGAPAIGPLLVSMLIAAFNAVYATIWTVFAARLYIRIAAR